MKTYAKYIIAIAAFILIMYVLYQPQSVRKGIFTEKLGDMTLVEYDTKEKATKEISNIYGLKDIPLTKGYSAVYAGMNGTMRIWVVESDDHNIIDEAFNSMNSKLGAPTGHEEIGQVESHDEHPDIMNSTFTRPVRVDIPDLARPKVYMIQSNKIYNYYYLKMDYRMGRAYWITFDYPDEDYQMEMVVQAILNI